MVSLSPQQATVLRHLRTNGGLTARTAVMDLRVQRLASRINELRVKGFGIVSTHEHNRVTGDRYVRYTLAGT